MIKMLTKEWHCEGCRLLFENPEQKTPKYFYYLLKGTKPKEQQ